MGTITELRRQAERMLPPQPPIDGGGGGGDDGRMEARVKALEDANLQTRDRLTKIETRMDALASKEDIASLKATLYDAVNGQTWKLITWVSGLGAILVAVTYYLATHVKP